MHSITYLKTQCKKKNVLKITILFLSTFILLFLINSFYKKNILNKNNNTYIINYIELNDNKSRSIDYLILTSLNENKEKNFKKKIKIKDIKKKPEYYFSDSQKTLTTVTLITYYELNLNEFEKSINTVYQDDINKWLVEYQKLMNIIVKYIEPGSSTYNKNISEIETNKFYIEYANKQCADLYEICIRRTLNYLRILKNIYLADLTYNMSVTKLPKKIVKVDIGEISVIFFLTLLITYGFILFNIFDLKKNKKYIKKG